MEKKTARLTVLIDPARKDAFEQLCHSQDMTPSQVMRRLIRDWMQEHAAPPQAAPIARKTAGRARRSNGGGKATAPRDRPSSR